MNTSIKQIILSAIVILTMTFTQSCGNKKSNEVNSSRDARIVGKWEFQENLGNVGGSIGNVINVIQDTYNADGTGTERTFRLEEGRVIEEELNNFKWSTSGNNQITFQFGTSPGQVVKYGFNDRGDALQLTYSDNTKQLYTKF